MASALVVTTNTLPIARADQNDKTAIAAAEAGIEDYLARMQTSNGRYWLDHPTDANNPALDTTPTTPSCDAPGVVVQTVSGTARYCYRVISRTDFFRTGSLTLEVTGIAGINDAKASRKVLRTALRGKGHADFAYVTDIEAQAPSVTRDTTNQLRADCSRYLYGAVSRLGVTGCQNVIYDELDRVEGPVHSNDRFVFNVPPTFTGDLTLDSASRSVTTSAPALADGKLAVGSLASGSAPIRNGPPVSLPRTVTHLAEFAAPKTDASPNTDRPGCLYEGFTKIDFSAGGVRVYSPNTTNAAPGCPRPDDTLSATVPPLLYVAGSNKANCTGIQRFPYQGFLGFGDEWQLGMLGDFLSKRNGRAIDFRPCRGTAIVAGTVKSSTTVAAVDDIVIPDNIIVPNFETSNTMVGLLAGNMTWIRNPLDAALGLAIYNHPHVTRIDASIAAVNGSFSVENFDQRCPLYAGDQPTLTVNGSISQRYAGSMNARESLLFGWINRRCGSVRNFKYDTRLKRQVPPFFISPDAAQWKVVGVQDIS